MIDLAPSNFSRHPRLYCAAQLLLHSTLPNPALTCYRLRHMRGAYPLVVIHVTSTRVHPRRQHSTSRCWDTKQLLSNFLQRFDLPFVSWPCLGYGLARGVRGGFAAGRG